LSKVTDSREDDVAGGARIKTAIDELTCPEFDVEGKLFVDLLIEWNTPQP
jgi:hypothetical protein